MIVASIRIKGAFADTEFRRPITAGIVGAKVQFSFGSEWDNLAKTAVFRGCVTKDVVNIGQVVTIPAEVIAQTCGEVTVGVYGVNTDGTIAVPTVWTGLGPVYEGTDPSGDESTMDPTLPVWAQLSAEIEELKQSGAEGLAGGYYIPEVSQTDKDTMTVAFLASKEDMLPVESQVITLPAGQTGPQGPKGDTGDMGPAGPRGEDGTDGKTPQKGVDYFTSADREEMVGLVLAALPAYDGEVETL